MLQPSLSFQAFTKAVPPAPNALFFFLYLFLSYSSIMPSIYPWLPIAISFCEPWYYPQELCKEPKCRQGKPKGRDSACEGRLHCLPPGGATHMAVCVNGAPRTQAFQFALLAYCLSAAALSSLSLSLASSLTSENLEDKTGIQSSQYPRSQPLGAQLAKD